MINKGKYLILLFMTVLKLWLISPTVDLTLKKTREQWRFTIKLSSKSKLKLLLKNSGHMELLVARTKEGEFLHNKSLLSKLKVLSGPWNTYGRSPKEKSSSNFISRPKKYYGLNVEMNLNYITAILHCMWFLYSLVFFSLFNIQYLTKFKDIRGEKNKHCSVVNSHLGKHWYKNQQIPEHWCIKKWQSQATHRSELSTRAHKKKKTQQQNTNREKGPKRCQAHDKSEVQQRT